MIYVAHDVPTAIWCRVLRIPYALVYHGQGPLLSELASFRRNVGKIRRWHLQLIERLSFQGALLVAFPSNGARDSYFDSVHLEGLAIAQIQAKCRVIWNGVGIGRAGGSDSSDMAHEVRKILSGDQFSEKDVSASTADWRDRNPTILLTVSSLTEHKGVDRIPEFLSKQVSLGADYRWVVVGNGPLLTQLEREVSRYGLDQRFIHVADRIGHDMVLSLMEHSTYYVMLHRLSIFDMATLEAMAMGAVPVLSSVGGNIEVNVRENVLYESDRDIFEGVDVVDLRFRNLDAFRAEFSAGSMAERYRLFVAELAAMVLE